MAAVDTIMSPVVACMFLCGCTSVDLMLVNCGTHIFVSCKKD